MTEIKFGTDGWRAEIARDYTFENVSLVAHSVAETMKERTPDKTRMIVGHDRRFLSRAFAETVATVYAEHGFEVLLGETYLPTPAISWCAKNEPGAAAATVITASHNGPEWNGFKVKETIGGSARPQLTKEFERNIVALRNENLSTPPSEDFRRALKAGRIRLFNPMDRYLAAVKS
ncbi:MAG: phosphoglucomutase/phosphomannomutase family protein, partial [Pseudomonadota bacterium]